jgi:sulfur relay (sulfurtransferase) DsrF/TusC family protein
MTLIIISSPPSLDLEPIELVLALAAFEQKPTLLLTGKGLHYMHTLQQEKRSNGKSPSKVVSVLPMYDCEKVFVRTSCLSEQGLCEEDLHDFCRLISDDEIKQLINLSKHCVNF